MIKIKMIFTVLGLAILLGCASSSSQPISPQVSPMATSSRATAVSNRVLWGLWDITIPTDRSSAEVVPVRGAQMHLNLVRLLEVNPCKTCLKVSNVHVTGTNELSVDVTLTHPYPGLIKYTGFDVRGIFIAGSDYTFPVSGRKIAIGDGIQKLLNPDGFTQLFNPTEFPSTKPPALGYIKGKWATGGDLSATLNPFIAYKLDHRRCMFEAGGSETKTFIIHALPGPLHFGYALDGCWYPADISYDPYYEMPTSANCFEAYHIEFKELHELGSDVGSSVILMLNVWDHQGKDSISSVSVEAAGIFNGEATLDLKYKDTDGAFIYTGALTNTLGAPPGDYPALIRVVDKESDPNLGQVDAWNVFTIGVRTGWARTWSGSPGIGMTGYGVATDATGNIYVTGGFLGKIDFDPGAAENIQESLASTDAFLSKFDPLGNLVWARIWGGGGTDFGNDIGIDGEGNIYVTGNFQKIVDFDPGPTEDSYTSNGAYDFFVSKFDGNGIYQWARTWGSANLEETRDLFPTVAISSLGDALIAGTFQNSIDFDPGPGEDIRVPDFSGAFLSKFSSSGDYLWVSTWGTETTGSVHANDVSVSGNTFLYVTGESSGIVDFDPGSGEDIYSSKAMAFLSSFDLDGNFKWAVHWGSETMGIDSEDVASDSAGNAYVGGYFWGTVDFDPGTGEISRSAVGSGPDSFLSKFNPASEFDWVQTWGTSHIYYSHDVACDSLGNVFLTGEFGYSVDFDPGPTEDMKTSNGGSDIYLIKLNSDGTYLWAKTWGGPEPQASSDRGEGVATDLSGNSFVTGFFFRGTTDFDPDSGVDNHTVSGSNYGTFLSKFPPDGNW